MTVCTATRDAGRAKSPDTGTALFPSFRLLFAFRQLDADVVIENSMDTVGTCYTHTGKKLVKHSNAVVPYGTSIDSTSYSVARK